MKEFSQRLVDIIKGKDTNLRERIFTIITLVSAALAIVGMAETAPMANIKLICLCLSTFLVIVVVSLILAVKHKRLFIGSSLIGIALCFIVFPSMFFLSGGINGGATAYFALNIIYTCIMFDGKAMIAYVIMDVVADIITYGIGYRYPELIHELPTASAVYVDSVYSVIVVGIAVGIMIKMHIDAYSTEKKKVEEQNIILEENGKSKNSFFASMSHEIRTPINAILGFNEMIKRESDNELVNEYADTVQHSAKMLLSLVNDVLDLSQMDMGTLDIVPVKYYTQELFTDVVDMLGSQMQEKGLEFILDIDEKLPVELLGDKRRIEQVLLNLLLNAIKYTDEGSITFSVQTESKTEDEVLIRMTVQDTGIGIRKEELINLYDIFKRVDINQAFGGGGLGLTITKNLVDLMNGKITVDSIYTQGTTFTVILTQKIVDSTGIGYIDNEVLKVSSNDEKYEQLFEAPEARVLIVDDNEMNRIVVKRLLEYTRVQIDEAASGLECLEKTKEKYYHLIILDSMMPGMSGDETVTKIRNQENGLCKQSVIVAFTAQLAPDALKHYREMGYDAYLEKPINSKLLEKCLLAYLPTELIELQKMHAREDAQSLFQSIDLGRKKSVLITTDCVADLADDIRDKYDVGIMYLYIRTEHGRFSDTIEINSDNLSQYITEEHTGAFADSVSVEEYEHFFASQLKKADEIIHISMASESGKSYGVAVQAAESFDHVHVIDSKHISCGQSLLVMHAVELLNKQMSVDEMIQDILKARDNIQSQFILPNAKIFYETGYTSKRMMRFCDLLNVHPILEVKNMKIGVRGIAIGDMNVARKRFIKKYTRHRKKINQSIVYISQVAVSVKDQEFIKMEIIKQLPFKNVRIQKASFSTACNSGIGTFGFAYYTEK